MSTIICSNVNCRRTFNADGNGLSHHATCPSCGGAVQAAGNGAAPHRVSLRDLIEVDRPATAAAPHAAERKPVVFTCPKPGCGMQLRAFPDKLTRGAACPKCGAAITPAAVGQVPVPTAAPQRLPTAPEAFVRFRCPGCGVTIKTAEARLGERANCPRCGGSIVVGLNRVDLPAPAARPIELEAHRKARPPVRTHDGSADRTQDEAARQAAKEAARKAAEEAAKAKAEAERQPAAEAARLAAEQERLAAAEAAEAQRQAAEEETRRQAAEDAARMVEETARAKAEAERHAAEQAAEFAAEQERLAAVAAAAEAQRQAAEEETRRQAAEDAARMVEETARAKAEAERHAAEQAAKFAAEQERLAAVAAAAEAQRQAAEEETRRQAAEDAARMVEEAARAKAEAERHAAEQAAKFAAEQERLAAVAAAAEAQRQAAEEETRRQAAEDAARMVEEAARAKAEAERHAAEEAAKFAAEQERLAAAEAAEAQRQAAEEADRVKQLGIVAGQIVALGAALASQVVEAEHRAAEEAARAEAARKAAEEASREAAEEAVRAQAEADRKAAEEAARAKAAAERRTAEKAARAKAEADRHAAEEQARAKAAAAKAAELEEARSRKPVVCTAAREIFGPEKLDAQQTPPKGNLKAPQLRRLMSTSLGTSLGIEVPAAVYLRNGFRYIGVAAHAQDSDIETGSVRFRNIYSFDPSAAMVGCIRVGYDDLMPAEEMLECVAQLRDPRYRIVAELFWPHVSDDVFELIRAEGSLTAPKVVQRLDEIASGSGLQAVLAKHALAIACHNLAIARELQFATGGGDWSEVCWHKALSYWSATLKSEEFWEYIARRIAGFDDPRVKSTDLAQLREQMPVAILGINALFARTYEQAGNQGACCKHLRFIASADLPTTAKRTASGATVKFIAGGRLDPIVQKVRKVFLDTTTKFSRQQFEQRCAPLLADIWAVSSFLADDLQLPDDIVSLAEFDPVCDAILNAINKNLTFQEDAQRNILYGMLIVKRMLRLPISSAMRRTLEESLRSDAGILYKGLLSADCIIDPTRCWFMEWEEADPDASLLIAIYKITDRNVEYYGNTRRVSLSYNARQLLVPRSIRARDFHAGRIKDGTAGVESQRGAPRLWAPADPQATAAFVFGDRKAASVLGVFEMMNQDPRGFAEALRSGALSQWFGNRSQKALAAKVRELEKASNGVGALLPVLLAAAHCEVQAAIDQDAVDYQAACHQAEQECAANRAKEQTAVNAAIQAHIKQTAAQCAADQKHIAKVNAWLNEQTDAANKELADAVAAANGRAAEPLARGQAERDAAQEKVEGLRGGARLELPLLGGLAPAFGAAGVGVWFLGVGGVWWLAPVIGVAAGVVLAFGIGRAVRMRKVALASANLKAAKKALKQELTHLRAENDKKIKQLQAQAARAAAEAAARLKAVEDGKQKLLQAGQSRVAAFEAQWQKQLAERKAAMDKAAGRLRERLRVPLNEKLKGKPEDAKSEFPPFKGARSNGFKLGSEPTAWDYE